MFKELYKRFPKELRTKLENCLQDPIYHPEGSVYKHIKLVFEETEKMFSNDNDMLLVALFHDLGKIDTYTEKEMPDGRIKITNYGHEYKAADYIDRYIHLFADMNPDINRIKVICSLHMKAHLYENGSLKKEHKRKIFEENQYFDDLMKFQKCDTMGKKIKK